MTRINCGVMVQKLTDQHLLAEHREIKRLPSLYKQRIDKGGVGFIPNRFCLGEGHVSFFINKGLFTLNRYKDIYNECLNRGFDVEDYSSNWGVYKQEHLLNYTPTQNDFSLLVERISERITQSVQIPKYCKKSISKDDAISLLIN